MNLSSAHFDWNVNTTIHDINGSIATTNIIWEAFDFKVLLLLLFMLLTVMVVLFLLCF